jgi:rhodanese-related sulfurtransferase
LGVQAVGAAGVDKRIDVLATAMQAGMTVFDLQHLELGYAPPYNSAKDPVNMVGFVASNVIQGDCRIVHAENLNAENICKWLVLDVRSAEEFSTGHLPGAINLPIDTLRDHVSTLDRSIPVLVYCYVGYRGYLAYRILTQRGFNVVNLDGGLKAFLEGGFKL